MGNKRWMVTTGMMMMLLSSGCAQEAVRFGPNPGAANPVPASPATEPAAPAAKQGSCPIQRSDGDPLTVATTAGPLRGHADGSSVAFLGVPFAEPPVGNLRWKAPVAHGCWSETREAKTYGAICPQRSTIDPTKLLGNEDCLFLNVWTPSLDASKKKKRPVLFFVHGGAQILGSSIQRLDVIPQRPGVDDNLYSGRSLAENEDVVVVTTNYRLGALGFLAHHALDAESEHHVSGNYALLDMIEALRWVQDNIEAFGGDPSRVMLFGESAGAWNTCALLASPLAKGLFSSATMQSGACQFPTLGRREDRGLAVARDAGCDGLKTSAETTACLRAADPYKLTFVPTLQMPWKANPVLEPPRMDVQNVHELDFGPNVDGWVLPVAPYQAFESGTHNAVPVILGTNRDEMELFVPAASIKSCADLDGHLARAFEPEIADSVRKRYPCDPAYPRGAMVDATSDLVFTCPTRRTARALRASSRGASVYRYLYTHVRQGMPAVLRAAHSSELAFVFGTLGMMGDREITAEEPFFARKIQGYWARMAATGSPSDHWAPYDTTKDNVLVLDVNESTAEGVRTEHCDFWDKIDAQ